MKEFLHGLFYLILRIIMNIPFNNIRIAYLRILGAKIGSHVFIGRKCDIRKPRNIIIGDHVVINPKVLLDGRGGILRIGSNVDIALESIIWTESHDPHDDYHKTVNMASTIEDYVWIGCRAMIMPGINIGRGAVIAAGTIVTKNVEAMNIVAGVPAKIVSERRSSLKYQKNFCPYFL